MKNLYCTAVGRINSAHALKLIFILLVWMIVPGVEETSAQPCAGATPSFTVNLTGNPDSVWTSPLVQRNGLCCTAGGTDRCIEFMVTLDPGAKGVIVEFASGTIPAAPNNYQLSCGSTTAMGNALCLTGVGPHRITYCKPGTLTNRYRITSLPKPVAFAGNDTTICATLNAANLSGSVLGATGGRWTGGTGRYLPDSFTLNATYVPSQAEINAGFVNLRLITTGIGGCGAVADIDTVRINIVPAPVPNITGPMLLCEYARNFVYNTPAHAGNSYEWHVVGGTIRTGQGTNNISVDWDSAGPGYIYMIETAPSGCKSVASINSISRFDFNTNPLTQATIGPNAISADVDAVSNGQGYQITTNCGGTKGGDITIPGAVFDRGKMCMTFSFQRDENEAEFFQRGATRFYLNGGQLTIVIRVSNGAGGFTDVGPLFTGYIPPLDDSFRFYTFCYDSASGIARVLVNDQLVWNYQATAGRSLYWTGSGNAILGVAMDGSCAGRTLLDFSNISIPISINRKPRPVISGTSPVCEFTGTYTYSTPLDSVTSTYNWTITGGIIVSGQSTRSVNVRWNAAGTGVLRVTQTYPGSSCDSTATRNITINPKPYPVITGPDTACRNQQYNYSVTPVAGNTYAWVATGGTIVGSSTGSTVAIRWGTGATGNVRVTQTNTFGCDSVMNKPVVLLPKPTPVITGPATTCQNHSYIYAVTPVAGHTYSWSVTGGTIQGSSTASSVVILWGAAATRTVTVTQSSTTSCDSTVNYSVTVRATPVPVISGPTSVCQNKLVNYSVTAVAGNTYAWSVSGGVIQGPSNSNTVSVRWGSPGSGIITVTQTNGFGCDSTVRDTATINPTPAPVITGPAAACQNKTSTHSVTAVAGHTYAWSVSGGTIQGSSTGSSVTIRWGAAGSGIITMTQTLGACDSVVYDTVTINPTPAPVITGPAAACQNKTTTHSVTAVGGHSYAWSVTGGTIQGSSTGSSITVRWGSAGSGFITMTQTSGAGCDSTVRDTVTINPTPAPVITGPATTCQNHTYSYSVTPVAGHSYAWSVSGGTIQGSSTGSTVVILWGAAGTGISTLTQTSAAGCDSTVRDTVTINPTPAPVITGPAASCQNKTSTHSVTAVAGHSYTWSVTGGTIQGSSTGSSVIIRWGAAGSGFITMTQTNGSGCDSTVRDTVTINATPAPVIAGPATTCQNHTFTYSVTPVAGHSYAWSVSGGTIQGSSTGSSVNILWGAAGTGITTLTQTSAAGCDSTVRDTVTINPTPAPVITGSNGTCQNKLYTYSVTAVAGHTYSWSASGGVIQGASNGSSVQVRWGAAGAGSVTMTQTSAAGCDSTVSYSITIRATPAPVITGVDSTCQNKLYTYSVTAVAGHTYTWSATGGTIQGSNNNSSVQIRWGAAGTGYITMTQISAFSCDSTVRDTVTILPTPAPVITGTDSVSTCQNKLYTYSVTAAAGHSYAWSVTGGVIQGPSNTNSVQIRWAAPGTGIITVTQTSGFGCDSTVRDTVTILPTPAPVISGTDSTCQNKMYTYSVTAVGGHTYAWSVTGGVIQGPSNGSSVQIRWGAAGTGIITITQTSASSCDSTVRDTVTILPTPAPVISGTDSTCQNKMYTYSTPAVAGHSYAWSVTGGVIQGPSNTNSVQIRWGAAGSGIATLTQTSAFGCDSTVRDTVTILPTPAPVISGQDSTCQNKMYNYSTPAVAGNSYSWSVTGGVIQGPSTNNTVQIRWGAAGMGIATLTQTSAFGCDSIVRDTVTILPTPAPVISGADSTCQNKMYMYSTPAVAGHSYAWSVTGGVIQGPSNSNTVNIRWGAAGSGIATLTQTSAFGCDSTVRDTVTILPTPAPVISGTDSTCQNKMYTYSTPAVAGHSYAWSVTGGVIQGPSNTNSVQIRWGAAGSGIATLTQTSAFGCDSTVRDTVTILPTPAPVISGTDSTCQNKMYTYSVTAVAGHTYSWSVTGGVIQGPSNTSSVQIRWGAAGSGIATLTQTSAFGCDSTVRDTVTILPTPAPVISGTDSTCQNKMYTYSTPAVAGHSYAWSVTGGVIQGPSNTNSVQIRWGAAGSGIATLTQTSAFGCDSTVRDTVTILPTPAPVISGTDSTCQNKMYTYSVTAVAGHTYAWSVTGGVIQGPSNSNTVNIRWGAAGSGIATLTQTSAFGCDSTVRDTVTILPTPAPVISGTDSTCQNKMYTYSTPAVAGHSYAWSVTGGVIQGPSNSNTVDIRWGAAGMGIATLTQTSAFGCDSTVMDTVTILPTPAPVISGTDSTCQNKMYTYSTPAVAGHSYAWSVTGGVIQGPSNGSSVQIRWGAAGSGIATLTQTSAFGCDSTVRDTVTILPTPAPVISGTDSTCQNKMYTYSTPAVAGHSYAWSVTGGVIQGPSNTNSVQIRWGAAGSGIATLTQTSAFGCDSTVRDTVTILPTPAPVISGTDSTCQNKMYTYSTPAVAGHSYAWSVTGGVIQGPSNTNSVQIRWGAAGSGITTLTQTSAFGCDSTVMDTVTILPTPAPVISGTDSTCQNKMYTYSTPAVAGHSYAWSVTGGVIQGPSNTNSVQIRWGASGSGIATLTQTSAFGCDSTVRDTVTILPTPAPVISGTDSTCQNKMYTYSVPAVAGHSYSWSASGGVIQGPSNSNTVDIRWGATGMGIATVTQTSAFGCDSTVMDTVTIVPTPAPVISGIDSICQNKIYTYSTPAVAGHTYSWSVSGGVIQGPSNTNSVDIRWGAAGTGIVTVTQTSPFGCDSTVHDTSTINPTPAPVITGAAITCQNKLYSYSVTAQAGHTYSWSATGGIIQGSTTGSFVQIRWGSAGTGTITMTQTSPFGCDSTVHDTITIQSTPAPVASGTNITCQNKLYTYTVTAVAGHSYSWSVSGGVIQGPDNGSSVQIRWGAPGMGIITMSQTNAAGCDSFIMDTVTIEPTPAPVISGTDSTCQNKMYTYSTPAVAGHTYAWSATGGVIQGPSNNNTVQIRWGAAGMGIATVTQTSGFGCDSTVMDTVTIVPTPAPVITGPDSTCQNKMYTYSVPAVAGHSYSWSASGGVIQGPSNTNTVDIRWGAAGMGIATVTQTSAFGCDSTVMDTTTILPTPAPVISGQDSTCQNKMYTYSTPAVAGHSYAWSVTGGVIQGPSTNNTVDIRWGATGTGITTLTQTSAFGCDSTVRDTVTILPTPTPVISGTDSTCQNKMYTYSTPAVAGHSYSWSVTGGVIQGPSTNNTVDIRWGAAGMGVATVTQTSAFGCDSTVMDTVTILPTPAPVISGTDSTCQNKMYTYSVPAVAGHSYSWSITGGVIQGPSTNNTVDIRWGATGMGVATVTQTSAFGCDSTVMDTVTILPTPAPVISGTDSTCQNKMYTYSVPAVAGHSYAWSVTGGVIQGPSTNNTVDIRWGAAGMGVATVTQTSAFGCDSTVMDTVTILPTPAPVISGTDSTCQNKMYTYSTPAVAGHSYSWSVSGGVIQGPSTNNTVDIRWGAAGMGIATLTQTSAFGCDSTVMDTVTILPTPAPVISGQDSTCENKMYTYSTPAVAGHSYAWSVTGGVIQGPSTNNTVDIRWFAPGMGIATLTQTSAFGCDSTVMDTVTIVPTPAPVISGQDSTCQNKMYTYSVPAVAGHSYNWSVSGGVIQGPSNNNTVDIRWGAAGMGIATLTQTSGFGCDSTVMDTVTIVPTPAPVITGPDSTCQNKMYTYSVPAVTGHSYSWSVSGGVIQGPSTNNTVDIRWGTAGMGIATLTQTSDFGCDSTVMDTVTILPTPAPVISGTDSTCQNKMYTYSTPAVAGHSYAWSVTGGVIQGPSNTNSVDIRWGAAGMGIATLTQTSAFGCDSTVMDTVTILPTPAPVISGTDSTCQNKMYTYSTPAVAGHSYSWSVTGGVIQGPSTNNTVDIRWGAAGMGVATVTQTSAFGCDSTVMDTVTILPTPAPVISGQDSTCENKMYTYSTPAVAGHSYSWSVTGGVIQGPSTNNTVDIRWFAPGMGIATLTQTSAFGCDSTVMDTVTIVPTPAPVISGQDSTCENKMYTYSTPAVAGHSYSWSVTGGVIQGPSTNNTVDIRWFAPGIGIATLTQTSGFGCDSTVMDTVTIVPTPAPVITGPDSTCQNKMYTYSTPFVAGHSYAWSVTGGVIQGPSNTSTVDIRWGAAGMGIATVTHTSDFGCDSTVMDTVVILPTPAPVISGTDSTCQNKMYTYSTPAVAGHTYAWSVTGGVIQGPGNTNTVDIRWGAAGIGIATVTQTSAFGCDSTVMDTVTIVPTPAPMISGQDSTCQNKMYTYSTPAVAGHSYAWSVTGGVIQGPSNNNTVDIRWGAAGMGVATVTQTSAFGCDSTVMDTVTIVPTPAPVISGQDSTCENKMYTYSTPFVAGHSYAWSVTGGVIQGPSTNNTVDIRWGAPGMGIATVTHTSDFGCDSTVMDTVTIVPTPAPVISGQDSTCQNKMYTYSTPFVAGHSYSWSVTGGVIQGPSNTNSVDIRWAGPGMGIATVTHTSDFGCDSTVMDTVTILPTPAPVISGQDSTCQNKMYTYSVPAVAGHSYSWSVTGGVIQGPSTNNTVDIRWGAAGMGVATVRQSSAFGCDSIVMDTVTILPTPAPVISGQDSTCENKMYTYSTPFVAGHSYSWSVTGGVIQGPSTNNTVDIRWFAPGMGIATLTQTSAFGCDSTVMDTVTIVPTPAPVISGQDSTCQNKMYTYSTPAVAGHSYAWSVTGGVIQGPSNNNTVDIRWFAPGMGIATLTQTSAFGCDSTVMDTVTIVPTPAPVITGPDSTCQNKMYTYSTPFVAGHSYSWSVTGGVIQGPSNTSTVDIRWGAAGMGIATVTHTSDFGCDSTVMDTVTILPTPAPVITGNDSVNICQNKLYTYSTPAVAGHTYAWTVTGGVIQGPGNSNTVGIRWGAPGTGMLQVVETSAFGCDSMVIDTITILPTPDPVISGVDSTCENKMYTYSTPAVAGHTYSWSVSGGVIQGPSNNNTVDIRWAGPGMGIATLTQTSAFGCDSTVMDTVTILPTPAPVISGQDSTCENKMYTYSVPAVAGHSYNWSVSGGVIQGPSTNNTVDIRWFAPGMGIATVTQTSAFGCDSTVMDTITIVPTPAPVISGQDSTCQNKMYTYSVPAVAGHSYAWSVTGGVIQGPSTNNTVDIRWAGPGMGIATVTQTSGFGCDSTVMDTVTIVPTPAPVISGTDSTCQNKMYTYSTPFVAGHSYAWSVTGGVIQGPSNASSVQIRWGAAGMGIATVTHTSDFGCDSTVMDTVTILPTPAPVISGQDSTCENKMYTYSTPAVAGHTYSWSVTGGVIQGPSNNNTVDIRWFAPGMGIATLTQTSAFGCDSVVMDTVTIVPTPAPVISGQDSTCENKMYTYSTPFVAGHSYAWSVTGGVIQGPSNNNTVDIRWFAPGMGVATVTQTSAFGCDSTVMDTVTIVPTPAPVISGQDSTCQNKMYTYSTPFVAGHSYNWSVSGGVIQGPSTNNTVDIRWGAAGMGIATVRHTSAFGCDSIVHDTVTILPTPAPVISGTDSTCQNKMYTYSVPAVAGHSYNWSVSGGVIQGPSNSNTVDIRWGAAGMGIATVTQASAFGCDSTVMDTVTIMPTPAPVISGTDSTCQNKMYTYSTPAVAGHSYSWSVTGGVIQGPSNASSVQIRWGAAGMGIATLTQASAFGCDSTVMDTVTILPTPAPVISGQDSTCQNKMYTYSTPAVAGHSYSWSVTGGAIQGPSTNNTVDIRWFAPGMGVATLVQTSEFGCDSIVMDTVTIVPTPAPVISGQDSTCQNKMYTYSTPAVAGHTYSWSVSGGVIQGPSNSNTVDIRWGAPGMGIATLTQTSAFGCDSTVMDTVTIVPTPAPVISGQDSTCQNKMYTYSTPFVAGHSYSWSVSGGVIQGPSNANSVQIRWGAAGMGIATVTHTSDFGCDSTVMDTVTILPTPAPVITGNDSVNICQNKLYTYSTPAVAGHSYSWSVTGGVIQGPSNSNTVGVRWGAPGTGTIQVIQASAFGCDSMVRDTITILPTPDPVISGIDSTCQNKMYTYSTPAVAGHTYSWSVSGGVIQGSSTNNTVNIRWAGPGMGIATVTQTSAFGCDSTVMDTVTILPTPAPVISGQDSTCQNKMYTYSTPFVAGHSYTWSVTGGVIQGPSTNNTVDIRWGAAGMGIATVRHTSAFGCDSIVHDTVTILPTPAPVISGQDSTCQNKMYTYSTPAVAGHSYNWSVTGGVIQGPSNSNSVQIRWAGPGMGIATVTQASAFGCDSTVMDTVTIVPTPAPVISGTDSTCQNKMYTYSTPAVAGHSYAWSVTGGVIQGPSNSNSVQIRWGAAGMGIATLTQTSAFGCDSLVRDTVTILPTPAPVISGRDSTCQNGYYTYSVVPQAGHSYTWSVTGGVIQGPANMNTVDIQWGATGAGMITMTQISAFGCDSLVTKPVVIMPTPAPVISGPDTVCRHSVVSYTCTSAHAKQITWSVFGGRILSGLHSSVVNVQWDTAGTAILFVNVVSPFGCDSTVMAQTVVLDHTILQITGPDTVCQRKTADYFTTSIPGMQYRWSVQNGLFASDTTTTQVTMRWDYPENALLTLKYTGSNGCKGTATRPVYVFEMPVPQIAGDQKGCANTQGNPYNSNLYKFVGKKLTYMTYDWSVSNGATVGGNGNDSIYINWGAPGAYRIYLRLINGISGCEDTTSMGVEVGDMSSPQIVSDAFKGCVPFRVNLRGQSNDSGLSYQWKFGNGGTSKDSATSVLYTSSGNYQVELIVTNEYGCKDTATFNVAVDPKPNADFSIVNKAPIYLGDTVRFTNTSTNIVSYGWTFHDSETDTAYHSKKHYPEPGEYDVTLVGVSPNGCADTVTKKVPVNVIPRIFVPNAFTPNGDSHNDYFSVTTYYIKDLNVLILNRWGEEIFRSNEIDFRWDGNYQRNECQQDAYVYIIHATGWNGEPIVLSGDVTLIR